jgi:hypothetical protein
MPIAHPRLALLWITTCAVAACDAPGTAAQIDVLATADDAATDDGTTADEDAVPPDAGVPAWGESSPLVQGEAWRMESAQADPLGHERPAQVECPSAAWGPELGGLEIQTGTCNYFFATQPGLVAIEQGDAIDVVVFHERLDAAEPAEGHVAILVDDELVWEAHVEIPSEANVLEARVIAPRAWPAGATVGLHLHNHGYNAWTVLEVSVAPRDP